MVEAAEVVVGKRAAAAVVTVRVVGKQEASRVGLVGVAKEAEGAAGRVTRVDAWVGTSDKVTLAVGWVVSKGAAGTWVAALVGLTADEVVMEVCMAEPQVAVEAAMEALVTTVAEEIAASHSQRPAPDATSKSSTPDAPTGIEC